MPRTTKSKVIKKINEVGVANITMERSDDDGVVGALAVLTLKNGEQVYLCQYFELRPAAETPYIEIFTDGNSSGYCPLREG